MMMMMITPFVEKRSSSNERELHRAATRTTTVLMMLATVAHLASAQSSTSTTATSGLSCVQTVDAAFSGCPCDAASFEFSMQGITSVTANTVNFAVVLDGSGSISYADWDLEKAFAMDAAAAFASRNLFENGGTASYVHFSTDLVSSGTFVSLDEFNAFVDADAYSGLWTNIEIGISTARSLLNADPSSASFMIVITDGEANFGADPAIEAELARQDGTTVFAVGVGSFISTTTLLSIAGDASNVFNVTGFDALDQALVDILSTNGSSVVPCPSTGATITVEFSTTVSSSTYPGASISGNTVSFAVDDLEDTLTEFSVELDTCNLAVGTGVVVSTDYTDDQGNSPDLSPLLTAGSIVDCDDGGSVSPTTTPAFSNAAPTAAPTSLRQPTRSPLAPTTAPPSGSGVTISPVAVTEDEGWYDCAVCSDLTTAEKEALASYDNGGKKIVCDPTCLDGVSDPTHCNYFGLGQVCRGCGDCSVCTPCP